MIHLLFIQTRELIVYIDPGGNDTPVIQLMGIFLGEGQRHGPAHASARSPQSGQGVRQRRGHLFSVPHPPNLPVLHGDHEH